jgi:hypothetical protein
MGISNCRLTEERIVDLERLVGQLTLELSAVKKSPVC